MAFEYLVDLGECVDILEKYRDIIMDDRDQWSHEGDLILPARSVIELSWEELTEGSANVAHAFDAYARQLTADFDGFFSLDHARFDPATALDGWLYDQTKKEVVRVPHDHWWWHPIGATGDD